MDLRTRAASIASHRDGALVLFAFQGEDPRRTVAAAGKAHGTAWSGVMAAEGFAGKALQLRLLQGGAEERFPLVAVVGLGDVASADLEIVRQASSVALRALRDAGATSVSVALPSGRKSWLRPDRTAQAVVEGACIGLYRFEDHKTKKSEAHVTMLTVLAPRGEGKRTGDGVDRGQAIGEAVCLGKDLGNQPGNVATPTFLAETAARIAEERGLSLKVLEEADMEALGMGALLAVSRGSRQPAKLIVLTYEPRRRKRVPTVALVGKGLTFDSGGISIKPGAKMEDMKFDMCGGATVLATMEAVGRIGAPVRVVGIVPASENLPDGDAYKPGDILKALNGTTIEIRNTDAEGRLILADALSWATTKMRPKPKVVIDLATLTGACLVALGDQHAGLISNDDELAGRIAEAGGEAGDPVWRLPLTAGYRKQIESPYADISNLGAGGAGTITAAAFLERFVGKATWAHLDIAGMAWTEKQAGYLTRGATGFGVRLLARLLSEWRE